MAKDEKLESVLYYLIEKVNKTARRYSQEKFALAGIDITVDQWLVMKKISDNERISQIELADALFKDRASITRTLDLLLDKSLIKKDVATDKRAYELSLTTTGAKFIDKALPIVKSMRKKGIEGMTDQEIIALRSALQKMIDNLR